MGISNLLWGFSGSTVYALVATEITVCLKNFPVWLKGKEAQNGQNFCQFSHVLCAYCVLDKPPGNTPTAFLDDLPDFVPDEPCKHDIQQRRNTH